MNPLPLPSSDALFTTASDHALRHTHLAERAFADGALSLFWFHQRMAATAHETCKKILGLPLSALEGSSLSAAVPTESAKPSEDGNLPPPTLV